MAFPEPVEKKDPALATDDESARKHKLKEIFRQRYAELKTTPGELEKKMSEAYRVKGETCDRAVLLGAANYLGIEMPPPFGGKKTNGNGPRSTGKKRGRRPNAPLNAGNPADGDGGTSKTARLQSDGTLTLSPTLDLFRLNTDERKFVFELIDKLDSYVQPAVSPVAPAEGPTQE